MRRLTIVLDEETLEILEKYMVEKRIFKYSQALREIIRAHANSGKK